MWFRGFMIGLLGLATGWIAAPSEAQQRRTYSDTDWNTSFVDSCGLPWAGSVTDMAVGGDRKLRFSLRAGDKGKCSTDNQRRHRAPFWERAELSQAGRMPLGTRHRISAEVTFMRGFMGEREAFFQIHGWAQACKRAYPPVMVKFKKGQLAVEALRGVSSGGSGNHRNVLRKRMNVRGLYGKPLRLIVDFDTTTRPGRFSLSLDGRELVTDAKVDFADCAQPYVKVGVYRPGGKGSGTSVVLFDDLRIEGVE